MPDTPQTVHPVHTIALIGGTGPEGRGLAARFALAGHRVLLGSRDVARAAETAHALAAALSTALATPAGGAPGSIGRIEGAANGDAAAAADMVVLAVPYEAHAPLLDALRPHLAGKIVVDTVVPVRFDRGPRPVEVPEGSATEQAAALLPESRVVGAFHTLAAEALTDVAHPVNGDVLIVGTDAEAKATVVALAAQIAGVRVVDAGPLRYARFVEGLTILLIGINGRYHTQAGVQITALPADLRPAPRTAAQS